jgi:hypothetical protein
MNLQDALFNWLQIHIVAETRQGDRAARETLEFFEQILREDHGLTSFDITSKDETMIHVAYEREGTTKKQMINRELAEQLLTDINADPKYN